VRRASPDGADHAGRVVFVPCEDWSPSEVVIRGAELHHIAHVLRFRKGERVEVVDGAGGRALVEIVEISRAAARGAIVSRGADEPRPPLAVRVAPAVIRAQRMDWLIEKVTELGAAAIAPVISERTVVKPGARGDGAHSQRWERIAIAAMKQSRRATCPRVFGPVPLETFLDGRSRESRLFVPWERAGTVLNGRLSEAPLDPAGPVDLLIGPEGGFSDSEADMAREKGAELVHLGRAVLRSETAAIAALTILLHRGGSL